MNKKDDTITVLEFRRVRNNPAYGKLVLLLAFIVGIIVYYITGKWWSVLIAMGIGAAIYFYLAINYRCPDCRSFLWYMKDKQRLSRCPKCQAMLREGPVAPSSTRRTRPSQRRRKE